MNFNVSRALRKATDEDLSRFERAIWLFRLQVAVANCKGAGKAKTANETSDLVVEVCNRTMRDARAIATVRLFEYAIEILKRHRVYFDELIEAAKMKRSAESIQHLENPPDGVRGDEFVAAYRIFPDLFDGKLLKYIRYSNPNAFNDVMERGREIAQTNNSVLQILLRYESNNTQVRNRRRTIGPTLAMDVLFEDREKHLKRRKNKGRIKNEVVQGEFYTCGGKRTAAGNWARLLPVVLLLHIFYDRRPALAPQKATGKRFASKLLAQIESQDIRDIAPLCESLRLHLEAKGHSFSSPDRRASPIPIDLPWGPLPAAISDALR